MTSELNYLHEVYEHDRETLVHKAKTYGDSWRKRDGNSVFHMIARKWDRIENICEGGRKNMLDVIREQEYQMDDGCLLAEVADLRRYLLLIEAFVRSEVSPPNTESINDR